MVKIWLEEVKEFDVNKILNNKKSLSNRDYVEFCYNNPDILFLEESEFYKLADDHPIKKKSKPIQVEMSYGYFETKYVYESKTIYRHNEIPYSTETFDIFDDMLCHCNFYGFNTIMNLINKGHLNSQLIEKYNENCYFFITE